MSCFTPGHLDLAADLLEHRAAGLGHWYALPPAWLAGRCKGARSGLNRNAEGMRQPSSRPPPDEPPAPVLLVDDEPRNLLALEAVLAAPSLELVPARSGAEALRQLEQRRFAAVLLDVHMPGMDGYETATRIRELGERDEREIPILFVTGIDSDRARVLGAYASGAVDFIQKPLEPEIIRSKLAVFVALFRAKRRLLDQIEEARRLHGALRAREELLAVVAHDLRSPLGAVLMAARRIEMHAASAGAPMPRGTVDIVVRATRKMARMIDDLLDLARLDAGNPLPIEPAMHDVGELVARVLDLVEPVAAAKNVTLASDVPTRAVARCDGDRVEQVLGNLVDNAIKFTPEGGSIRVAVQVADAEVLVSVSDTGPGIAADLLPHVFDRYRTADPRRRRGIGLGLSIVKAIVDAHGGRVWVQTSPGARRAFHVAQPAP